MVSKKDKHLAAAQKLLERGQLDKALGEFAKVVQEDPKDTRTWLKMAELHAKRGAAAEATEIYLKTADLYGEQGFAQKAVAVYKNVLKLSPGTVAAHVKLGALYRQLGLVSDSVQQYELAAAALQRAGKAADAVAALRQAAEAQPDNIVLRVKLAESASQAALTEEAVREFARAADQLKALGRSDEYLRVVERLLFHQPENFTRARELAEAYIAKGSPRLALPKLQACLKADPRDPRTLSLLAKALEQLGQVPKALSVLKELIRLYQELGRASERDAAILRALTLDPGDPELQAAASRYQLRGNLTQGGATEATPPPMVSGPVTGAGQGGGQVPAGGSFDLSGTMLLPGTGGSSGRVVAPMGGASTGRMSGSLGAAGAVGSSTEQALTRILAEAEVFVKYGLLERAADHLGRVFNIDPTHRGAREKLVAVLEQLGRKGDAARQLVLLAEQVARRAPTEAVRLAEQALLLDPGMERARALLASGGHGSHGARAGQGAGGAGSRLPDIALAESDEDPAADQVTPPPHVRPAGVVPARGIDLSPIDLAPAGDDDHVLEVDELDVQIDLEPVVDTPAPRAGAAAASAAAAAIPLFDDVSRDGHTHVVGPAARGRAGGAAAIAGFDGDDDDDDDAIAGFGASPTPAPSSGAAPVARPAPVSLASPAADDALGGALPAALQAGGADDEEVAAELDQVDFFLAQSMPEDAIALLQDLVKRFPADARIVGKLRELQPSERPRAPAGGFGAGRAPPITSEVDAATPAPRAIVVDDSTGGAESDLSTHADLGIAYKEMGLHDAAIGEFKVLAQDPRREVFALTMMGECFEAKGAVTEAVLRYKRALNCETVTEPENLDLYFLLGCAFERLGDMGEALYYYEKVSKRDPKFRDVDRKIAELKPRIARRA